ncbi:hypothetical protein ACF0H5_011190 [Mactra antiquata]
MNVTIDLALMSIVKVDELQESVQLLTVVFVSWKDDRLVWNSSDYNNTKEIFLPVENVWHPEFFIHQPTHGNNRIGDIERQLTHHYNSGLVKWNFVDTLTISCSFDLTQFPWDVQTCDILFVVWGYQHEHIRLKINKDFIILDFYEENSAWSMKSTKAYVAPHPHKSKVGFQFVLQRRPDFFVMTIFLPIILLSVLSIFVFMIPIESGERISFSFTILLTIVLFITLVSSYVPQSAESIPAMCFFLLFQCIQCVTACVGNIISIKYYYKKGQPGKVWQKITTVCGRKVCTKRKNVEPVHCDDQVSTVVTKEKQTVDMETEQMKINWMDVSKILDIVFAIIMIMFSLFCYSIFGYYLTNGQ